MAQSSNALREPTMDEILNSIREIIEENTAQANQMPAEQTNLVRQVAAQPVVSQPANRQSLNYTEANSQFAQQPTPQFAQQPNFPQQKPVTVDEAMQALAKRIGLTTDTTNTSADTANTSAPATLHLSKHIENSFLIQTHIANPCSQSSQKSNTPRKSFICSRVLRLMMKR